MRVKYTENDVLYCWDGKVENVSDQDKRAATFFLTGVGVTIHKRKSPRVKVPMPFSFMVFDAAKTEMIGDTPTEATTRDVSVSGLSFKSELPLTVGDQLQLTLQIPPPSPSTLWVGWFELKRRKANLWWRWSSCSRRRRIRTN